MCRITKSKQKQTETETGEDKSVPVGFGTYVEGVTWSVWWVLLLCVAAGVVRVETRIQIESIRFNISHFYFAMLFIKRNWR